jgi:ferrochelatase
MAAAWTDKHIADLLEEDALAVNPSLAAEQATKFHTHNGHHHDHGHSHSHGHGHHHH